MTSMYETLKNSSTPSGVFIFVVTTVLLMPLKPQPWPLRHGKHSLERSRAGSRYGLAWWVKGLRVRKLLPQVVHASSGGSG